MNNEGMLKPALIGGVLLGILSAVPLVNLLNCLCCAWVIGGGVLASYLYVKGSPAAVTLGRGVGLGLLTGILGAVVDTMFSVPIHLVLSRIGTGYAEQIQQYLNQILNLPPESRDALRSVLGRGGLNIFFLVVGGIMKLVIYSLVAMLGGAIGVAIFERRKPGAETPRPAIDYQPPLPPPPDAPTVS